MGLGVLTPAFNRVESNVSGTPSVTVIGTSVPANSVANTKGSTYTTLIAATASETYFADIIITNTSTPATITNVLVDIAIGAAAAETVIIPDLLGGHSPAGGGSAIGARRYQIPIFIPEGSRVSARSVGAVASNACNVAIYLHGGLMNPDSWWCGRQVTAYGITAASSRGTLITPGNTGAEGSYTQIVAATTTRHKFLFVGAAGANNTVMTSIAYHLDLSVGAATESPILSNMAFNATTNETTFGPFPNHIWTDIPSGTRIAMRGTASGTAQTLDCAVYGVI